MSLAVAPVAVAQDEPTVDSTTKTAITAPADPYFDYYDYRLEEQGPALLGRADANDNGIEDGNELVISGTADGNESLGIGCFYGSYGGGGRTLEEVALVEGEDFESDGAGGYTWSITVDKYDAVVYENSTESDQTCRLAAVPVSAFDGGEYDPETGEYYGDVDDLDLRSYTGPRLGMGVLDAYEAGNYVDRAARARGEKGAPRSGRTARNHDVSQVSDYYATFPQLRGYFSYYSASSCGLCYGAPFSAGTFAQPDYTSWEYGAAQWTDQWSSSYGDRNGSMVLVDGQDAFHAYGASTMESFYNCDAAGENCTSDRRHGAPELSFTLESFDHTTGDVTFLEREDLVKCDPSDVDEDGDDETTYENGNPTAENCEQFVPVGVRFERRVTQNRAGQVSSIKDTYTSTDGAQHVIDVQSFNETGHSDYPVWKLPGADAYAAYGDGDQVDLPEGEIGTFYARDSYYGDNPHNTGGPVSLTYNGKPSRAFFDDEYDLVFEYERTIAAGGSTAMELVFGQAMDKDAVEALGRSIEDRLGGGPTVDIVSPADGSATSASRVTVSGQADDNVEVTQLKVNGRSVPVQGDGTWATELELSAGENTITAEASDGEGQKATDTVTVRHTPPAPPKDGETGQTGARGQAGAAGPAGVAGSAGTTLQPGQTVSSSRAGRGLSAVTLRSKRVKLRGDEFILSIACARGTAQNGTIRARALVNGKRRNFGTEAFQCPGGGNRTVDFDLSRSEERRLRNELRRKKSIAFVLYVVGRDLAGEAGTFRQTFSLVR